MQPETLMHLRACSIVVGYLTLSVPPGVAQTSATADSDLTRAIGHWTAAGVSFQSGDSTIPFVVDVQRKGDALQATLPADLKVAGGQAYVLARTGSGVFQHVDRAGRIVAFTLTGPDRASLLVTGTGGDGRITWQLRRAP